MFCSIFLCVLQSEDVKIRCQSRVSRGFVVSLSRGVEGQLESIMSLSNLSNTP